MAHSFLIIVTGLPASGKTTLAAQLAVRYRAPLLGKDLIKEPLLDVIGASDARASRRLSDASFCLLAAIAAEIFRAGGSCILEGNFRAKEHEALLAPLIGDARVVAQVLCRTQEADRLARLRARAHDARRHRGHRDLEQASAPPGQRPDDEFLDLPGERLLADAQLIGALDSLLAG